MVPAMNSTLAVILGITLTGWKIIGLVGALCFAGRWVVQFRHRQRTGSAAIPTAFWLMSVVGAAMTTVYFVFGKNDSVGIVQNALPLTVALYNLWHDLRPRVGKGPVAP
jgi:lipid-A-disaccharide synthase-like uncharacterized protein